MSFFLLVVAPVMEGSHKWNRAPRKFRELITYFKFRLLGTSRTRVCIRTFDSELKDGCLERLLVCFYVRRCDYYYICPFGLHIVYKK